MKVPTLRRPHWRRRGWMLALAMVFSSLFITTATTTTSHADPCFFSQAAFDDWLSEYGNSYHDSNYAGWGDSLGRVQDKFAGGCAGSWGSTLAPGTRCGIAALVIWRVWPQSDGDQTMIAFKDNGAGASPRYTARCQAGTMKPNGDWRYHFWESHL